MAAFVRTIEARIDNSYGQMKERAARFAERERDRVLAQVAPLQPEVKQFVDGVPNAPLVGVNIPGTILFKFLYTNDVFKTALQMLVDAAPRGPAKRGNRPEDRTHYYREFKVFINGVETTEIPENVPHNAEVVITNYLPYARKVEKKYSAPDGVFREVARLLKRRYSNSVNIQYKFVRFPGAGPFGPAAKRGGKQAPYDDDFPAIVISALS